MEQGVFGEIWKLACLFKTKTILRLTLAKETLAWDNGQQTNQEGLDRCIFCNTSANSIDHCLQTTHFL